jgi:hypothetical protein
MFTLVDMTIFRLVLLSSLPLMAGQAIMSNQLDLSQLTTQQLINLLWEMKGTTQAQPLYKELSSRPAQLTLEPDDPDWERKMAEHLRSKLTESGRN